MGDVGRRRGDDRRDEMTLTYGGYNGGKGVKILKEASIIFKGFFLFTRVVNVPLCKGEAAKNIPDLIFSHQFLIVGSL